MDDERLDSQADRATNADELKPPVKFEGKHRPRETDGRGGRIDTARPDERAATSRNGD